MGFSYWFFLASRPVVPPPTPPSDPIYLDSSQNGCQTIFGTTGKFKVNPGLATLKRTAHILHLAKAKPKITTITACFDSLIPGTRLDPQEFFYQDGQQTLTILNASGVCGLIPTGSYAIPISLVIRPRVNLTNIYAPSSVIPTVSGF